MPPECRCRVPTSGLALADDGVRELFRGIELGLGCPSSKDDVAYESGCSRSGCGVRGDLGPIVFDGIGGACIMLIRFILRVSVGDMVLAPRPDILPLAVDCRLLPDEFGVVALLLIGRWSSTERCVGVSGSV